MVDLVLATVTARTQAGVRKALFLAGQWDSCPGIIGATRRVDDCQFFTGRFDELRRKDGKIT